MEFKEIQLTSSEIMKLFINRCDIYARKNTWGGYITINKMFDEINILKHLSGKSNYGIYQLDINSMIKWIVIDIDSKEYKDDIYKLSEEIKKNYINERIFLEETRRGYHIWICLQEKQRALIARTNMYNFLLGKVNFPYELFPKQNSLSNNKTYGNLVNLIFAYNKEYKWKNKVFEVLV